MDRIRIMLADDHAMLREVLQPLLNTQPDMEVVAEAGTAAEAVRLAATANASIILLDITFPDQSGIGVLPELLKQSMASRVVMLTMHEDPAYLRSALAAGAAGYVVKSSRSDVLLEAIRTVSQGKSFIDPSMRHHATPREPAEAGSAIAPIARLSDRERQVLISLVRGLRYQAIADKLGVSVKTVETYRSRLRAKLGFTDRADLMRFAIESGILTNAPND